MAGLLDRSIRSGSTKVEIADELGIGSSQIANFLRLLSLDPEVSHLACWGRSDHGGVSFSSLAEISRLPMPLHNAATHAAMEHKLTWKEVVQLVQVVHRRSEPFEASVASILELRPTIDRQYIFVGKIGVSLRAKLTEIAQCGRDALLKESVEELLGGVDTPPVSGRLGLIKFHLVTAFDLLGVLGVSADQLEMEIGLLIEYRITER